MPNSSPEPTATRQCHFISHEKPIETQTYDERALQSGVVLEGPAVVTARHTTYLVEPGWQYEAAGQGAVWFTRDRRGQVTAMHVSQPRMWDLVLRRGP